MKVTVLMHTLTKLHIFFNNPSIAYPCNKSQSKQLPYSNRLIRCQSVDVSNYYSKTLQTARYEL